MSTNTSVHIAKFKAKAKSLLKSVQAGDANALNTIQPYFKPDEFKPTQAQLVIARTHHCSSWKELIDKINWGCVRFAVNLLWTFNSSSKGVARAGHIHLKIAY